MKNLKNIYISMLAAFVLMLGSSCSDDNEKFMVSDTAPIVLSDLTIADIELDPVNINNPAVTFNWTEADYGQQIPVSYEIQLASDALFTNATVLTKVTSGNTITVSVTDLNSASGKVGLPPFAWNKLYARVTSSIGSENSLPVPSNSISFNIFPYFNYIFNDYYFVGNGVAPGWNNNSNNPALFRDADNSNLYHYTGYFANATSDFNEGRFKIIEKRGSWQPQWGVKENEGDDIVKIAGDMAGNPGTQTGDPGRFGVTSSGYYSFTFNFSTKKYTMAPFDASGATNFTGMEIQGSATAAKAMTQSAFDAHIWNIKSVHLVTGNLQFKTNTGAIWAGSTEFSGKAIVNGGNIPVVVEDDYEVWFNDLDGRYILIPLNL